MAAWRGVAGGVKVGGGMDGWAYESWYWLQCRMLPPRNGGGGRAAGGKVGRAELELPEANFYFPDSLALALGEGHPRALVLKLLCFIRSESVLDQERRGGAGGGAGGRGDHNHQDLPDASYNIQGVC